MKTLTTSVAICGAGPAGLTLAHLLGSEGIEVVLIERLESTVTEPRAIAIDGESLRTLQKTGLLTGFEQEILDGLEAEYVNGDGELLFRAGSPQLRPYGFATVNSFDQPALDSYLARSLSQRDSVSLLFGHTLNGFSQDETGVRIACTDDAGEELAIHADYLVGCDGGQSSVRSLLGIKMQGESNPQPWLVIDTRDSYLENALDCRFYCDPLRPGMTIRKRHGERRWEWMVMPGEDREFLLDEANIRKILARYTDADQVQIYRKRVYDFHAIIAEKWQCGRVFLAGDAAHMTPPFAGQGLNSGFRDVSNLSWKLAMVIKGHASPDILDTYELERRDHAKELIETALNLGRQIQPIDPRQAKERDDFFAALKQDSDALQAFESEMLKSVMHRSVDKGLVVGTAPGEVAGRYLVQPQVSAGGRQVLLDECLGQGFSIVGYDCGPGQYIDEETLAAWQAIGSSVVTIASAAGQAPGAPITDRDNAIGDWLGKAGPMILLIRPDRFCMAAAAPGEAQAALHEAMEALAGRVCVS